MLTKTDLKEIGNVVLKRIKKDVPSLVEKQLSPLKNYIKTLGSDVTKIRKDIDVIVSLFDREYLDLRKRVTRIEEHLELPPIPQTFT